MQMMGTSDQELPVWSDLSWSSAAAGSAYRHSMSLPRFDSCQILSTAICQRVCPKSDLLLPAYRVLVEWTVVFACMHRLICEYSAVTWIKIGFIWRSSSLRVWAGSFSFPFFLLLQWFKCLLDVKFWVAFYHTLSTRKVLLASVHPFGDSSARSPNIVFPNCIELLSGALWLHCCCKMNCNSLWSYFPDFIWKANKISCNVNRCSAPTN